MIFQSRHLDIIFEMCTIGSVLVLGSGKVVLGLFIVAFSRIMLVYVYGLDKIECGMRYNGQMDGSLGNVLYILWFDRALFRAIVIHMERRIRAAVRGDRNVRKIQEIWYLQFFTFFGCFNLLFAVEEEMFVRIP